MDRRVAILQYDANGLLLEACSTFICGAPGTIEFFNEVLSAAARLKCTETRVTEVAIGADNPIYRIEGADCIQLERSVH